MIYNSPNLPRREAWLPHPFDETPEPPQSAPIRSNPSQSAPKPATAGDIALAGPDGTKARDLLRQAKQEGQALLAELVNRAVKRIDPAKLKTTRRLFTPAETAELAKLLETVSTTAELLGRSSVRLRATQSQFHDRRVKRFSDEPTQFHRFDDTIPLPPSPEAALAYFRKLVPSVSAKRARDKKVFTMYALDADQQLLGMAKNVITQALEGKESKPEQVISDLLEGKESQLRISRDAYAELVTRTNMMASYSAGITAEQQEMPDVFPVWLYAGIADGREGKDHAPHFGKYYPVSMSFDQVRGARKFNCRCIPILIDATEWQDLQKRGVRLGR